MSFPITWNIDGTDLRPFLANNNYQGLFAHLDVIQPKSILIMDNLPLAVRIKERFPNCVVVHRDFSEHQGDEWRRKTPQEFVNRWIGEGHPEIVRYLTNEPSFDGGNAVEFATHEAQTLKLAKANGFRCVALNTSVGSYQYADIQAGKFDVLLDAIILYDAFIGCHEYYTVSIPASLFPPEWLSDPVTEDFASSVARLQADKWLTRRQVLERVTNNREDEWYIFRHTWFIERLQNHLKYSLDKIGERVLHTEFGYDNIGGSSDPIVNAAVNALRLAYGDAKKYNSDMRGVDTYRKLHAAYWPHQNYFERIRDEFKWWLTVKPSWIHSACLFAFNADWDLPEGHDYSAPVMQGYLSYHEQLAREWNPATEPPKEPIYFMKPATIYSFNTSNLREAPNTNATVVIQLGKDKLKVEASDDAVFAGSGHMWYKFRFEDGQELYGAKTTNLVVSYDEVVPDPDPEPDPTPEPDIEALVNAAIESKLAELFKPIHIDIPLPDITVTIPDVLRLPLADAFEAQGALYTRLANRLRSGTPSIQQIANEVFSNVSVDTSLLDEILNGEDKKSA